jgi:hypothetical protein
VRIDGRIFKKRISFLDLSRGRYAKARVLDRALVAAISVVMGSLDLASYPSVKSQEQYSLFKSELMVLKIEVPVGGMDTLVG